MGKLSRSSPAPIQLRFRHAYAEHGAPFSLDVDVELPGSGIIGIFGHSGSGKTTLLRCIAGLEPPDEGYLSINGDVWQDGRTAIPTHRRSIGCVFQEASLLPHLTARKNLFYGMKRAGTMGDTQHFQHIETLMGIGPILDQFPHQLSGGQRQRVAIARALLLQPHVLLMDEPLASLDSERKQEILPYLERLRDEVALPVFYVSHAIDEVARLADHLVMMDQGRMVASGAIGDVLSRVDPPTRLGNEAGVIVDASVEERDTHWHLARMGFDGGSLWVRDGGHAVGHRLRLRVLARDVSLALINHEDTSILNRLPAVVTDIAGDGDDAMCIVQLRINATYLIARLTRRSAHHLNLKVGKTTWTQIKSVAIVQ